MQVWGKYSNSLAPGALPTSEWKEKAKVSWGSWRCWQGTARFDWRVVVGSGAPVVVLTRGCRHPLNTTLVWVGLGGTLSHHARSGAVPCLDVQPCLHRPG